MAHDLSRHPFFEAWVDPETGVESFVLTERVAPVQQSFYFTNPSVSRDGNWLWFYTKFPPADYQTLGVVCLDPAKPVIRHFPRAAFCCVSPMVADEGDAIYYCARNSVWRMDMKGVPAAVCALSEDYIHHRRLERLVTHLTRSADGRYFLLDGEVGNHWFVGLGDTETGEVKILKEFGRHYDHAQFSPTDPELFLIAQDWWRDSTTGQYFIYDQRIWLMDITGERFEPLRPKDYFAHNSHASHEWWSADGLVCWLDYKKGAYTCDPVTRETAHVWRRPLCHGHCDATRTYWCADQSPYEWDTKPCQVKFLDSSSRAEVDIVSAMPRPAESRDLYHIDPHPQFSPDGEWIVYTTTVRGAVDVALAGVGNLAGTANETNKAAKD